jgi:2,4-dienoyl-CoA reductase (NADPH2)
VTEFPNLFSPVKIGALQLRNRLIMSPMENSYATLEGEPSSRSIAFFEARARGGIALITLGACTIDESHREVPRSIHFGADARLDAHRELTQRVQAQGARIQPQLVHPGPDGMAPHLSGLPNIGPSVIPSYLSGIPCRELDIAEIPGIVEEFAAASERVREAGYDGIELHAAHGYMLLGSFLTPNRNRRKDGYSGSSQAGRCRLLIEVIRAIKAAAGEDFPLTLRISGHERIAAGRPSYDTAAIAAHLVEAGVNAFHISGGVIDPLTTQMVAGSHLPPGHNVAAAQAVKEVVDVPVIAVGRIHDPALAEKILSEGRADLIAMGRPLLADSEWPNKARTGRAEQIRYCISCQHCIDSMQVGRMACAINAFTGHEYKLDLGRTFRPERIAVVGGGVAGLEAARIAAERGHSVTIYEARSRLGGALRMASIVHAENQPFLNFLISEVKRLQITVELNSALDADQIENLGIENVVLATGGRHRTQRIPGDQLPHVLTGKMLTALLIGGWPQEADRKFSTHQRWMIRVLGAPIARLLDPPSIRLLTRYWLPLGHRVAIIGANLAGIELAEFLAERGRRVNLLEAGDDIGSDVGPKRRFEHIQRLEGLAVTIHTRAEVIEISRKEIVLMGGGRMEADSVIVTGTIEAEMRLAEQLHEKIPGLQSLGDARKPELIAGAMAQVARMMLPNR